MKYWYYKNEENKQWYWRLRADNNRIIAVAGEGYNNLQDCLHAIDLVKGSYNTPVEKSIATR